MGVIITPSGADMYQSMEHLEDAIGVILQHIQMTALIKDDEQPKYGLRPSRRLNPGEIEMAVIHWLQKRMPDNIRLSEKNG